MTFDGSSGGGWGLALLAFLGAASWIGVLITAVFGRRKQAADSEKVRAEAAQIFTDMATKTVTTNEKLHTQIVEDNARLRAELEATRRQMEEQAAEHEAESRRLLSELGDARSELTATRRELNIVREELSHARRELIQATAQMRRANEREDRRDSERRERDDSGDAGSP